MQASNGKFIYYKYVRNIIDVLRTQIDSTDSLNFCSHSVIRRKEVGHTMYHHMMKTEFAKKAEKKRPY